MQEARDEDGKQVVGVVTIEIANIVKFSPNDSELRSIIHKEVAPMEEKVYSLCRDYLDRRDLNGDDRT